LHERDRIQLSLHGVELVQEQNPGPGSEEITEGGWKKHADDNGGFGKRVMEISE